MYDKRPDIRLVEPPKPGSAATAESKAPSLSDRELVGSDLLASYDCLLDRFMPPSFLVDESARLLDCFAGAERFLRTKPRRPSNSLIDLLDGDLRTVVAGALPRLTRERTAIACPNVPLTDARGTSSHHVRLQLVRYGASNDNHVLVTIEPSDVDFESSHAVPDSDVVGERKLEDRVRSLRNELAYTGEALQTTAEELETSNDLLQVANEELIASNEKLQRTNEELRRLNAEHQAKVEELEELNADIEHLLEGTEIGAVFLGRDLRIRRYTERIGHVFRLQRGDIGREIRDFSQMLARPNLIDEIERALLEGAVTEDEVRDERGTPHLLRILPYHTRGRSSETDSASADERPTAGVVLTITDISVLDKARARLAQLSAIVESSEDAIWSTNLDGEIETWNRGAERLYGYSASEAIGRDVRFLCSPEEMNVVDVCLETIGRGERVEQVEALRVRRDGIPIDVSITISPVFDERGNVVGGSAIARDIGQLKAAHREVARRRERFLALLSHELRNPLAAVLNAVRIVSSGGGSRKTQEKASQVIERQGRHMARLLDDLLDVSRITNGKFEVRRELVRLDEVVMFGIEALEPIVRDSGLTLMTSLPDVPIFVAGDGARLQQVIANLLSNAARYSYSGSRVEVSLRQEGDSAVLVVRDWGRGIDPAFLPRIFDMFAQGEQKEMQGGLGIGLALVRRIVELHDGTVEARSAGRDLGSEFVVSIPCSSGCADPRSQSPAGTTDACRIVLVEDQPDAREMMHALLELRGHSVVEAVDGTSAIESVMRECPDVAIVDIGLPDVSGYDVARAIRGAAACDGVFLIALTGYGSQSDVRAAQEAGFDAHLTKPAEAESLYRLVATRRASTSHRLSGDWSDETLSGATTRNS